MGMFSRGVSRAIVGSVIILIIGIAMIAYGAYLASTGGKVMTVTQTVTSATTVAVPTTVYKTLTKTVTITGTVTSIITKTTPISSPTTTSPVIPTTTVSAAPPTTTVVTPVAKGALHTTIIYLIQNDASARVLTLKRGVADRGAIPADQINAVVGTKLGNYEIVKQERPSLWTTFIVLNTLRPPLNNPLVRQALAYAIPYEMIYKTVYANLMVPLYGVIPKGMLGWTDYNIIHYKFDLNKAKELLRKSGINPAQFTITIYYNQGNVQRAKIATLLSTYWGQLGFKVMVQSLSWPQLLERISKPEFDVYIIGWAPDYLDPDNYAGPLAYGGTKFDFVKVYKISSVAEASKYLSKAKVIDTPKYLVIVGPAGSGASISVSTSKPILVVQYKLAEKQIPPENCTAFVNINPAFYRNVTLDALIIAGRYETDPVVREALYNAIQIISNHEVPIIWLGQNIRVAVYWSWLHGIYFHPTLAERYDLEWESPPPVKQSVGIGNYVNDEKTLVIATFGWPHSFDPAKSYETFGWEIFREIGDTLVTFWKEETKYVMPDLAVAWAHTENGTVWFFVIRGGVKAYDPWHNKLYPVNATDVLFTLWRIARLQLDPSWMITEFIDVNNSYVLTEKEFAQLIPKLQLATEYMGKEYKVTSFEQLLKIFGYSGETAGIVVLKLYRPYAAILNILADPFTMVIPAKYLFDYAKGLQGKYLEAMEAAKWGKNPSAWAKYIQPGEKDPTHELLNRYPVGTGPYYVAEYKENAYIILKINPYYWNKELWIKLYGEAPKAPSG